MRERKVVHAAINLDLETRKILTSSDRYNCEEFSLLRYDKENML